MDWKAKWICPKRDMGDVCPEYIKHISVAKPVAKATLYVTAMGTYEALLNGKRISDYVLAPGWTVYNKRHQYQSYDVTDMLGASNELSVTVGKGWYHGVWEWAKNMHSTKESVLGIIAQVEIEYQDGTRECIATDANWQVRESFIRISELFNGENADATQKGLPLEAVSVLELGTDNLIPNEGEMICEQDRIAAKRVFKTPGGETVVDFGQNVTGYVEFTVTANAGDKVELSHAEVLDKQGNFYTGNYRSAKAKLYYTCCDGEQTYKPHLTFYGFRYIRLDEFPNEAKPEQFTAILVSSKLERTGYMRSGHGLLNRFYENAVWGHRDNFLDVPTDCPQRDERLGWTCDAQVYAKTACYNYDVRKFYAKWLRDLAAAQHADGGVPNIVPEVLDACPPSSFWSDAAILMPWQIYLFYGDTKILEDQFDSMAAWHRYVTEHTEDEFLWTGGFHYGDWLALDVDDEADMRGASRHNFIASALYAHTTDLMNKICVVLGKDNSYYAELYEKIVAKFRETFPEYITQTEHILALIFNLTTDQEKTAEALTELIFKASGSLQTGFVGTPYLLFALSQNGYAEIAYDLLLKEDYPSWLYAVNHGATTVWEHWDSIKENGDFWSDSMNSFNHYAFGSVIGWVYEVAAGIKPLEEKPGFETVTIAPHPDERLGWLEVKLATKHGEFFSGWYYEPEGLRYEIQTPVTAHIKLGTKEFDVAPGRYLFFE